MASSKGGIGFLLVLGLIAVGYSNSGWGSTPATADGNPDDGDGLATCDGVLEVDSASGSARVPGDTGLTDATVACEMEPGAGDQDAVATVQHALAQCHGQAVRIDGEYGAETAAGLSSVQSDAGIAVDGEYGPATLEVMRWPVDGAGECVAVSPGGAVADEGPPGLPATG